MHTSLNPPDKFAETVRTFHGYISPGVIVGGYMVEKAKRELPVDILYDAVSETTHCLPDAIQLLTPCTLGNGWLRVVNLGRYALCLYDKENGNGVRVFLDPVKVEGWSHIGDWYLKRKPKKEQDTDALLDEIYRAGEEICGIRPIRIAARHLQTKRRGGIGIFPTCREAYPVNDGDICRGCRNADLYEGSPAA
ncbi:FmdE family protein [Desulfonatronum thioautotrophicum]|uniref:FmdE family protein n=1 Tax=Desulfonatronum thioautotrophicum TaxID=617001 RepID=UPI0005EBA978|nr:FmdE family protein [Desulfonatronum thioautotrophicum]